MSLDITENTLDNFKRITGFDITQFLVDYENFNNKYYSQIIKYYSDEVDSLDQESVSFFEYMQEEYSKLEDVIINTNRNLDTLDYWNLLSFIDEVNTRLRMLERIPKFIRSSKYDNTYEKSIVSDYTATDIDTPEGIARKTKTDSQNEWVKIYQRNNISELDYRAEEGGYIVKLSHDETNNVFLASVIDIMQDENLYGKDMDAEFIYEEDDVRVLTPRETARQGILTLGRLTKGDIPENVQIGLSPDIAIGSNLGFLNIPFIIRELTETFSVDDTILNFRVKDVETKQTTLFVEFECETFYNYKVNFNVEL